MSEKTRIKKKLNIGVIILIGLLIQSCDPTYPVSINNQTESEIRIQAKKTLRFWNENLNETELTQKDWIEFKIEPKKSVKCGMTIGGLKDDIPFSNLKIYTDKDTIIAQNRNEVLNLFDKNWIGNLKTPYTLTIK